jgi:hypothetical protein
MLTRRARLVGRVAQAQGAVAAWFRDAAVRLLPDSATGRQLLAIQDWRPPAAIARRGSGTSAPTRR